VAERLFPDAKLASADRLAKWADLRAARKHRAGDLMAADESGRDLEWVRSRVLHVIGHELRTPITTVRGLADALVAAETDPDPEVRAQIVDALQRNARRLEGLLDDLLAAADVTTSLPVGDPRPIPLGETIRQAWSEVGRGGLTVDDSLSARGLARPDSVRRILSHVLDNAVKYGTPPVTVRVYPVGSIVRVDVDSPGAQLPEEDVCYATEPFWRGERAVTMAPGLGLGLAVARTLAAHEGGDLFVQDRRGGGLLTVLEFPGA
jgi:signal transduction histidine kinase